MLKLKTVLLSAAVVAAGITVPALTAEAAPVRATSSATVKLTGYSRVVQGVVHYRSLAAVKATMQIQPRRAGRVTVSLQHRSGTKWITDQNSTFATDAGGGAWAGLAQGNRRMTYRFVVNSAAAASPKVTTPSFMVD